MLILLSRYDFILKILKPVKVSSFAQEVLSFLLQPRG